MTKALSTLAVAALSLFATSADACRPGTLVPQLGQAGNHHVMLVEVTGVRLTDYAWYRAATLGLAPWPESPDGEPLWYVTSSTPGFKVDVIVKQSVNGSSSPFREFSLGGCGIQVPQLKATGLIFISPDGRRVGAVWSDGTQYGQWLEDLGLSSTVDP